MPVTRLIRVSITVADLGRAADFYRDRLGLEVSPQQVLGDPAWNLLLELKRDTTARAVDVVMGEQAIKLVAFDPPGSPYPADRASNDQWFEHVALVTRDIGVMWERLERGVPGKSPRALPCSSRQIRGVSPP